eukprot:762186-Hanusia_phi.AAC.9
MRACDSCTGRRFAKQILKNYGEDATLSFPAFLQYASTREDLFGTFVPQSTTFRPESKRILNSNDSPVGDKGKDNLTQLADQEMKNNMDSSSTRPYSSSISVRKSQRYPIMYNESSKRNSPLKKEDSSVASLQEEILPSAIFIGPTDHPKRKGYSLKRRPQASPEDEKIDGVEDLVQPELVNKEENQALKGMRRSVSLGNIYSTLSSEESSSYYSTEGVIARPDRWSRNERAQLRRPPMSGSSKKSSDLKSTPLLRRHINLELGGLYRSYQLPGRLFRSKTSASVRPSPCPKIWSLTLRVCQERRAWTASTSSSILLEDDYNSQDFISPVWE